MIAKHAIFGHLDDDILFVQEILKGLTEDRNDQVQLDNLDQKDSNYEQPKRDEGSKRFVGCVVVQSDELTKTSQYPRVQDIGKPSESKVLLN